MRTRMLIGTENILGKQEIYSNQYRELMDRLVMREKVPFEITRHILSFAQTSQ